MLKVLVTGANGFIGDMVVRELSKHENLEIIATDMRFDETALSSLNITQVPLDLFANASNPDLHNILGNPDCIIHLAYRNGFVHDDYSHIKDLESHIRLYENFNSFPQIKSITFMGTMHEIGYHEGVINSSTPCNPTNFYGIAKNALRQFILGKKSNCSIKWLRAYYIYDNNGRGNSIFSKIYKAAKEGKSTFPLTSGKNMCDYISLDMLAYQIVEASLQNEIDGIINVCSGRAISLKDAVSLFVKHNNININFEFNKYPDRPYDSPFVYGDGSAINKILESNNKFGEI